jgi:uncharacterized membrane protein
MTWLDVVLMLIFLCLLAYSVGMGWALTLAGALVAGVVGMIIVSLIRGKRL